MIIFVIDIFISIMFFVCYLNITLFMDCDVLIDKDFYLY